MIEFYPHDIPIFCPHVPGVPKDCWSIPQFLVVQVRGSHADARLCCHTDVQLLQHWGLVEKTIGSPTKNGDHGELNSWIYRIFEH